MRGPTLPFAPMKTYGPISINLREKRKKKIFLSFSFFSLSLSTLFFCLPKNGLLPLFFTFLIPFLFFYLFIFLFIFFFFFLVLSFPLFPPLDTWLNLSHSHKCTTCHATCHPDTRCLKKCEILTVLESDGVTRFSETNSTVKFVLSSKI